MKRFVDLADLLVHELESVIYESIQDVLDLNPYLSEEGRGCRCVSRITGDGCRARPWRLEGEEGGG
jgi:hypothetical protein